MIMKGTTPRGLSWNGVLGLFGLAGLMLPLSPTWAQDEDKAKADRDVVVEVEVDTDDDSDLADLDAVKKKLAAEIQRIRSLEKQAAEKAHAASEKARAAAERARAAAEKRRAEAADVINIKVKEKAKDEEAHAQAPNLKDQKPDEKADNEKAKDKAEGKDKRKDEVRVIEEKEERAAPQAKVFRFERRIQREGRPAEVQIHRIDENVAKELAHAKLEVDRARAQLDQAERQLARLNADLKAKTSESRRSSDADGKPELQKRGLFYAKPDIRVHEFDFKFKDFDTKFKDKGETRDGRDKADDRPEQPKEGDERRREIERSIESKIKSALDSELHRRADDRTTRNLTLSRPDANKKIAELEAMRGRYEDALRRLKEQIRDFDHDPAAKQYDKKLKEIQNKLEAIVDEKPRDYYSKLMEDLKGDYERLKALQKALQDEKAPERNPDSSR